MGFRFLDHPVGVLIRHHYADDYAVTHGCRMSQRKHSLIITTDLNRSVQPNSGKGEGWAMERWCPHPQSTEVL